ncbi:HET domain-containingprotein [Purpureocillium lavendulum]|uniref:HET domain-containingprotein n=1 Tax=Purpureocillium lavendulum TaxID=1247861 RepID=A0AB34FUJ0_9HYPO|nr:HET domain-containingprotein [Purpureocillium lavendulum]
MRLINVESLVLEEFMAGGSEAPPYAILSHTWGDGEVTFQDFTHSDESVRSRKHGFDKISKTCALAKGEGLKYAWVDTCCIDKTSSAELTEAINSMFQWYRDAVACYAWLGDLPSSAVVGSQPDKLALSKCRWFTRGWTLQELIAPRVVQFYDEAWVPCGTKESLAAVLSDITKVDAGILADPDLLPGLSVAKRMSWAAARRTTRVEDTAYCLLGIFDVNMPMLYGEGAKAFLRLQEELARASNDLSLFAWRRKTPDHQYAGVFATSPVDFADSRSIELAGDTVYNPEYSLTNKGLHMSANLFSGKDGTYLMKLNCNETTASGERPVGISIRPHGGGVYCRANLSEFREEAAGDAANLRDVFLFRQLTAARAKQLEASHSNAFMLRKGFNTRESIQYDDFPFAMNLAMPREEWDSQRGMFLTLGAAEFFGYVLFARRRDAEGFEELSPGSMFMMAFGKTGSQDAWVSLCAPLTHSAVWRRVQDVTQTRAAVLNQPAVVPVLQMRNKLNKPSSKVAASIKKDKVDGREVHCIDLVYLNGPEAEADWARENGQDCT